MKVLLDTCVILDAMQNRGKYAKFAQLLLIGSAQDSFNGCVTSKQICDLYYILNKVHHNDEMCRQLLSDIFDVLEVVDCSSATVINARLSSIRDYEGAVLVECAKEERCNFIVTSNLYDFKKSTYKVIDPIQACQILVLD